MKIGRQHVPAILIFLLIVSVAIRIWLTLFRHLNADEFQHLHSAWMVHLGYLPYRDFWENHGPLLHFLLAPLLGFVGEGPTAVVVARFTLSAIGLLIVPATYVVARTVYDRFTALLACVILCFAEIFLQKTIEVRTDQFLVISWITSIWFVIRGMKSQKRSFLATGGLVLGLGMLASPKALICLAAACLMLVSTRLKMRDAQESLVNTFIFVGSFFIPVAAFAFYLQAKGIFHGWLTSTLLENLSYPDTRGPDFLLRPQNLGLLLLGTAGMILTWKNTGETGKFGRLLMVPALFTLIALVFLMPSTYSQSALLFVPLFSIFAAYAWRKAFEARPLNRTTGIVTRSLVTMCALLFPLFSTGFRISSEETNREQMDVMEHVLQNTSHREAIFDGNCAYVFRRQAYYYGSLVEGIRYKMKRGELPEKVVDSLRQQRCRVLLYDDRVSDLPQEIQDFLRENYLPSLRENVWIAGKELGPQNLSQNRAVFTIEIPGLYRITTMGEKNLRLANQPFESAIFLKAGAHQLHSKEPMRKILIEAVR